MIFALISAQICAEIKDLRENGITVHEKKLTIEFFFVADFKVIYSVTGAFGSTAKFACPWCRTPNKLLDKTYDELKEIAQDRKRKSLSLAELQSRPAVKNL